jgi:hypothetical protein
MRIRLPLWGAYINQANNQGLSGATGYGESTYLLYISLLAHTDRSYRREQPWVDDPRMKKTRVGNWITFGFIVLGIVASGYIMYTGVQEAQIPDQCLIMEDHFETINSDHWGYEIQVWHTNQVV